MDSSANCDCEQLRQRIADLEIQLENERKRTADPTAPPADPTVTIRGLKQDMEDQKSLTSSQESSIPQSEPGPESQCTRPGLVSRGVSPIPFLSDSEPFTPTGSRKRDRSQFDSSNNNSDTEIWASIKRARHSEDLLGPNAAHLDPNGIDPVDPTNGKPLAVPLARLPLPGVKGSDPQCANCGTKQTPMWRRGANLELNCNACALYAKLHNCPRPCNGTPTAPRPRSRPSGGHERKSGSKSSKPLLIGGPCTACQTQTTPLWRKDAMGRTLCNACGLRRKTNPKEPLRAHVITADSCAECRTQNTPMWRRDATGRLLCNACGLRQKMYRAGRHITFGGDVANSPLQSLSPQPAVA